MAVPFRIGVMQLTMDPLDEMLASARAMDEAGMDTIWLAEAYPWWRKHGMEARSSTVVSALMARETKQLTIGWGIIAASTRHPVQAGDIDAVSVRVARDNVRLNRAGAFVRVITTNGLADRRMRERAPYDLVFANILLGPVRQLATPIHRVTAPGANVVISGLLSSQSTAALAAYRARGFVLERRIVLDGWVTLVLVRAAQRTCR